MELRIDTAGLDVVSKNVKEKKVFYFGARDIREREIQVPTNKLRATKREVRPGVKKLSSARSKTLKASMKDWLAKAPSPVPVVSTHVTRSGMAASRTAEDTDPEAQPGQ